MLSFLRSPKKIIFKNIKNTSIVFTNDDSNGYFSIERTNFYNKEFRIKHKIKTITIEYIGKSRDLKKIKLNERMVKSIHFENSTATIKHVINKEYVQDEEMFYLTSSNSKINIEKLYTPNFCLKADNKSFIKLKNILVLNMFVKIENCSSLVFHRGYIQNIEMSVSVEKPDIWKKENSRVLFKSQCYAYNCNLLLNNSSFATMNVLKDLKLTDIDDSSVAKLSGSVIPFNFERKLKFSSLVLEIEKSSYNLVKRNYGVFNCRNGELFLFSVDPTSSINAINKSVISDELILPEEFLNFLEKINKKNNEIKKAEKLKLKAEFEIKSKKEEPIRTQDEILLSKNKKELRLLLSDEKTLYTMTAAKKDEVISLLEYSKGKIENEIDLTKDEINRFNSLLIIFDINKRSVIF